MKKAKGLEQLAILAAKRIIRSNGLVFTAGAGMGVDSGLPSFRGQEVTSLKYSYRDSGRAILYFKKLRCLFMRQHHQPSLSRIQVSIGTSTGTLSLTIKASI